jgi:hypothetical protein
MKRLFYRFRALPKEKCKVLAADMPKSGTTAIVK